MWGMRDPWDRKGADLGLPMKNVETGAWFIMQKTLLPGNPGVKLRMEPTHQKVKS